MLAWTRGAGRDAAARASTARAIELGQCRKVLEQDVGPDGPGGANQGSDGKQSGKHEPKKCERVTASLQGSRLGAECLNTHWFYGLDHARETINEWLEDYNERRPHSSLAGLTPSEYEKKQIWTSPVD